MRKILIAPSILSADFSKLGEEIRAVESAGADWIHVDVMDGHFVPNLTIGPVVVQHIRPVTKLPLDVHLMISKPERYAEEFIRAGSDIITFHVEACQDPGKLISVIRGLGKKAGITLRPKTPVSTVKPFFGDVDLVLIMTVEPGFGGQKFMEDAVQKVGEVRKHYNGDLEVDGGITSENAKKVIELGANVLVAGTSVFRTKNYKDAITKMKKSGNGGKSV
jgi:ribulose-phosphate 3-epimerase